MGRVSLLSSVVAHRVPTGRLLERYRETEQIHLYYALADIKFAKDHIWKKTLTNTNDTLLRIMLVGTILDSEL